MKTTNVLIGLVAAAAAGVAVGMLIAPEKGTDLQKKLKDGAQDWLDEISRLVGDKKKLVGHRTREEEKPIHDISNN
jgi:gas vesicle protein